MSFDPDDRYFFLFKALDRPGARIQEQAWQARCNNGPLRCKPFGVLPHFVQTKGTPLGKGQEGFVLESKGKAKERESMSEEDKEKEKKAEKIKKSGRSRFKCEFKCICN